MDGRNEGMVGEALKGYRDRVYVATKGEAGFEEAMIRSIDESLSSLKVDYVDLLQLHALSSAEQVMNTEYREVLARPEVGKDAVHRRDPHSKEPDVLNAVTDDPDKLYDTVLVTYNFQKPPEVKAAIAKAAAAIGIIAMKTQAGGYQTRELSLKARNSITKQQPSVTKLPSRNLARAELDRVSWFRAAARHSSTTPASSTQAVPPAPVLRISRSRTLIAMPEMSQSERSMPANAPPE